MRWSLSLGFSVVLGAIAVAQTVAAPQSDLQVYRLGPGISAPVVLRSVQPKYTADALRAKIQGTVGIDAVVLPNGTVGDARVVRSLDRVFGLDDEAVVAAKQWLFKPAIRNGEPVAVLVTIELAFRLSGPSQPRTEPVPLAQLPEDEFTKGAHRATAPGITAPKPVYMPAPRYTRAAMEKKISGIVQVDAVVAADGTVDRVRIAKSIDTIHGVHGLDDEALATIKLWTFTPARLGGAAVPCLIRIDLEFKPH